MDWWVVDVSDDDKGFRSRGVEAGAGVVDV